MAYAEPITFNVPFPPPYHNTCSYSIGDFLIFNCIIRGDKIPEDVKNQLSYYDNFTGVLPPEEIEAFKDKIIIDWLYVDDQEPEIEIEEIKPTVAEILKERLPPGVKEAVDRLAECQYGYDGWAAIQQQSSYEIPDQIIAFKGNLRNEVLVKRLNMAYEACDIQRNYPLSPMYQNFIDADLLGLDRFGREQTHTFNQTTDLQKYNYDPLTQEDFDAAEKKAEDFKCSEAGRGLGHCIEESTDVNRGNPNPIIKNIFDYNQYINFKAGQIQTEQDYIDTITAAKAAQCTVHYPIYKHRITGTMGGMELPVWLEHCETAAERWDRVGPEGQITIGEVEINP